MPDEPTSSASGPADTAFGPVEPTDEPGYDGSGVPSFDLVREKIQTRYQTSIGAAELDTESPEGRSIEEQYQARQRTAADRLAEIRESMHEDTR